MYEHIFDIINFNDKYEMNGLSKFESLLETFGLTLSTHSILHYEWVNHNHTLILITEYNPLTGEHAFEKQKTIHLGFLGYTEVLCEDKMLLGRFVNEVNKLSSRPIVF